MSNEMALVKVYSARDTVEAHFVRALLEREGIAATVLGDALGTAFGGIPLTSETQPAVWVPSGAQPAAEQVVQRFQHGGARQEFAGQPSWTCPQCGEALEPQFTECWSCGTARPDDNHKPVEPPPLPSGRLEIDVPCARCGYNLRGLMPAGRCPECGMGMAPSLLRRLNEASPELYVVLDGIVGGLLSAIAASAHCATSIVLPLSEAWGRALRDVPRDPDDPPANDAATLCQVVVEQLCEGFQTQAEASDALKRWGFSTPRDLARAGRVLMEQGLLEETDRIRIDEFSTAAIPFHPRG